ncbi:Aldehyde/histidinol dehydrogenase [Aspergillus pseudodeflectus]|uniref:aldehyde dehydrogenase (NAD(+)) n=1 Tax=Aspergillus pseudodeflectus TaxID=176178 RepID=A0ABR4JD58_9EURO
MAAQKHKPIKFEKFYNVINGELRQTTATRQSPNPVTEALNAEVPVSSSIDVEAAVEFAKAAFPAWAATSWSERRAAVLGFANALEQEKEGFARLLKQEQGKPLHFARMEIDNGVHWLRDIASLELHDEVIKEDDESRVVVQFRPLGVVVAIVPWNYPVMLACGKLGPALMTGNSVIMKPSPFTPYCGLKLAELAQSFFPPGVVQGLSGDDNLGPWLTAHPGVNKISFTGSTATGKRVMESASHNLTRVTLELGGNDAAIVCEDADLKSAVPAIVSLAFLNSGQICIAIKRIYVHSAVYDEFRTKMIEFLNTLKVNGDEDAFMGPVQNQLQYYRVQSLLDDINQNGYTTISGSHNLPSSGYFIKPTVVSNPPEKSRIVQEEPFGPVVPLLSWTDLDDVISRVNASNVGLGASIWSSDHQKAGKIAERIDAGSVWINAHTKIDPKVPFGGYKDSGIGCEWGVEGLKTFCNIRSLYLKK